MSSILKPTQLCGLELKNHLFRSATWVALCNPDGTLTPRVYDIYKELAEGGVGAIITELTDVSQWNNAIGDNMRLYSDELIEDYKKLASMVHEYGTIIIPQLNMYRYARSVAPHKIVEVDDLTIKDIEDIKQLYISAAVRAHKCGFDAIQLHLAYGWLLYRFISPYCNHRRDSYGGSIENRARIVTEIIRGIKIELPEMPICAKFSFYANREQNAYAADECADICRILYESGLDFIEVLGDHSNLERGNGNSSCYQELAFAVQEKCDIPIVLTGCNNDVKVMEQLMQERGIQFFAISRGLIREPDLPKRWMAGDYSPAKCVHCDGCYHTIGNRCRFLK